MWKRGDSWSAGGGGLQRVLVNKKLMGGRVGNEGIYESEDRKHMFNLRVSLLPHNVMFISSDKQSKVNSNINKCPF